MRENGNFKITGTLILLIMILLSCNSKNSYNIIGYSKGDEKFEIKFGSLQYNGIDKLKPYRVLEGNNYIVVFKRTGTTFIDANDYEARYNEFLTFELDSSQNNFTFCDTALVDISAKYHWIAYAKELKEKAIDVDEGCVKGYIQGDSLHLNIDIQVDFGFGGIFEEDIDRKVEREIILHLPYSG